jgi:hypothetical protein
MLFARRKEYADLIYRVMAKENVGEEKKARSPSTLCQWRLETSGCRLDGKGRNGWSHATPGLASMAMDRSADRVRR